MSSIQICPHPLTQERKEFTIGCGLSVREMLREVGHEWVLDGPAIITLECEDNVWSVTDFDTVPAPGETLAVNVVPQGGGGGGGKGGVGMLLSIVIIAVASYFTFGAGFALMAQSFGYYTAASVAAVGKGLIGIAASSLLSSALAGGGPQKPSATGIAQNSQTSAVYSITGTQNAANKFGPIPTMVGGTTRIWPPLAAEPYTETVGEDQFLRQRFAMIGPVELSDFKIGETSLENYDDVEIEWIQGFSTDALPTLYADGTDISEESVGADLKQVDGWVTRTTQLKTKEITYDIAQQQLFKVEGSSYVATSVQYDVSYRQSGTTGDWLAPDVGQGSIVDTGDGDATRITISGYYTNARLFPYRFFVSEGQYDVRWRRVTQDNDENTEIFDGMQLRVLRSIAEHPGIDTQNLPPLSVIDLRIKASGQLNGVVDQLNCIAQAYLPVWDGASTVTYTLSDNPAWAFFGVLYGNANKRPVSDLSRYDFESLSNWATLCESKGWNVNGILDTSTTVIRQLSTIASIGRASLTMVNNRYGVAVDWEKDTVIQVFTPRNSWGFESAKIWLDDVHAARVKFVDKDNGYELSEGFVYADGYDESTATLFSEQEAQWITSWGQVWEKYRYEFADRILRPEIYTFNVDIENLRCTRGDRVRLVHDVMLVGLGQARIKSVTTDGVGNVETATIDSLWTLDDATSYAINIQRFNGQVYEGFIDNPPSLQDVSTVTFNPAIPAAVAPQGGELIAFGEADKGVGLDLIIHEIQPQANLNAKLVCQDYAPGIQAAADGPIGPYDPQITIGRNSRNGRPEAPIIESVVSDETVIIVANDGTLITRAVMSLIPNDSPIPITGYQAQYRRSGSELWDSVGTFPPETNSISVENLPDGINHDFRVRALTEVGSSSEWTEVLNHTVIGKTSPPPDVNGMLLDDSLLTWTYPNRPVDFAGFRLRYAIAGTQYSWDTATPVTGNPLISVQQFDISGFTGSLVWLCKGEDTTGNQSENAAVVITNLGDPGLTNVIETWPEAPDWDGIITNGANNAGVLEADGQDVWTGVDANVWWSGNDSFMVWGENEYKQMTYQWQTTFGVGGELVITRDITDGSYIEFSASSQAQRWDGVDTTTRWTGVDSAAWWDGLTDWQPWVGGIPIDSGATISFRAISPAGQTQGKFTTITPTIDVPDIEETIEDVTISTGGTRLSLTKTYTKIKAVVYGIQDNGLGTTGVRVVDKDETLGPLLQAETANALIDARVQGY